ncbi:MAG: hypothetical protein K6B65_06645 [Bacilli bacterium]|nr:hypothetical protein [Bacilli bacterium]
MDSLNKKRSLLFTSLAVISLGIGVLLSSCGANGSSSKENGEGVLNLIEESGTVEFGSYPQTIVATDSEEYSLALATTPENGIYTVNEKRYVLLTDIDVDSEGGGKYSDGTSAVDGETHLFRYEPIKWHVLETNEKAGYTYLFSASILDTHPWQTNVEISNYNYANIKGTDTPAYDWIESEMRSYLNGEFLDAAFTKDEKARLFLATTLASQSTSDKDCTDYATLISKEKFEEYKTSKSFKPYIGDYAKARGVHYHFNSYDWSFFYLNSLPTESTLTYYVGAVRGLESGNNSQVSSVRTGVRPLIAIDNAKVSITTPKSEEKSESGSNPAPLIIGILFTLFGIAGIAAFFLLWQKGKISPKNNVAIIISVVAVLVASVGIITLSSVSSGGGGIGTCGLQYGYYIQAEEQRHSSGISQVGWTSYLIQSDHTAYYCGSVSESDCSDFRKEMSGTWTSSGNSVTLDLSGVMGTFNVTFTIECGGKLYHNGRHVYTWVRGE